MEGGSIGEGVGGLSRSGVLKGRLSDSHAVHLADRVLGEEVLELNGCRSEVAGAEDVVLGEGVERVAGLRKLRSGLGTVATRLMDNHPLTLPLLTASVSEGRDRRTASPALHGGSNTLSASRALRATAAHCARDVVAVNSLPLSVASSYPLALPFPRETLVPASDDIQDGS